MKMKKIPIGVVLGLFLAIANTHADTTGVTGGGAPFNNMQPSLVVTQAVQTIGIYPPRGRLRLGRHDGFRL